jgi:hypothetical protein
MNQYGFGYFPRNKYKDLVFYVKTGEHSNTGLFEMDDTEENRALMDALSSHPYQSERDKVLPILEKLVDAFHKYEMDVDSDYQPIQHRDMIQEAELMIKELRQKAGE